MRILLVDDHALVRQGLRALLEEESDLTIVGEAEDGQQAINLATQLEPDIMLMDLSMPGMSGIQATQQIRERFPHVRVVVLSMHENEEYVFQVLQAGASGYVLKRSTTTELVLALHAVAAGSTFLSPAVSDILIGDYVRRSITRGADETPGTLSARESAILQLIAQGFNNRQIAEQLHISIKTVETHRSNLMRKLDAHDRAELLQIAREQNLL